MRRLHAVHLGGEAGYFPLVAPSANFAISAAIALTLLAEFFLVEARLPQFPAFASIFVVATVRTLVRTFVWIYSDTGRQKLSYL
jgi:hypothetical protein